MLVCLAVGNDDDDDELAANNRKETSQECSCLRFYLPYIYLTCFIITCLQEKQGFCQLVPPISTAFRSVPWVILASIAYQVLYGVSPLATSDCLSGLENVACRMPNAEHTSWPM